MLSYFCRNFGEFTPHVAWLESRINCRVTGYVDQQPLRMLLALTPLLLRRCRSDGQGLQGLARSPKCEYFGFRMLRIQKFNVK